MQIRIQIQIKFQIQDPINPHYLEQVLVVLPLEEHDAVLEEEHVQVDRLEALRLAQLHRQLAVVDQPVLAQVKVLSDTEEILSCTLNKLRQEGNGPIDLQRQVQ